MIAQGNLVDTRNPADDITGTISSENPIDRVNEALDLISDALFNASENANVKNADIYTISAKINSNYVVLNQTMENQTTIKANLENNISSLKDVDKPRRQPNCCWLRKIWKHLMPFCNRP